MSMKNKPIYFIGIKGTGMAALARICYKMGYEVMGSDIERHFFTEDALRALNIPIVPFNKNNIKDNTVVIIGNAFLDDHEEVQAAKANPTVETYRYHEYLGKMMDSYRTIAVSGSHGKTTTTTLLRDMLSYSKETGYLIGDGRGDLQRDDEYFAVEACEFRRHFLAYKPKIAIMTNFEIDHVDYFKSVEDYLSAFKEFAKNVESLIVVWGDDPHYQDLSFDVETWSYGFGEGNKIRATELEKTTTHSIFDVEVDGKRIHRFNLPIVGDHMILDALAVIAVGLYEGIEPNDIEAGLQTFTGAKRRFVIETGKDNVYIDDYAHHPTEVRVTLEAARTRYPDRKIVGIFKPHRVGRVYYFADEFADALSLADEVCLCPFTSIDDAEEGIDIDITYLQDRIEGSHVVDLNDHDLDLLESFGPAVYVFMSSKDIYDLKDALKIRFND
ncbi:UDP-N-acetylmuramate--L-alanine ligase [Erysipelothrix rhusiopathiae]|uniref:UDP-N-acetylmuramate--L-alanine ligase n=2 Tax=Erysipelothrix rhusiopathiae TaxID=1648 RepID=UPI000E001710|nr:UDP-N-acetylmuramate--L-alanine ligase [Erysipelothrix rhusiopathiae]MDE8257067.1 UDP-N-acetylmuramate--L-alanine ligase [Erysipelothrix rhusiopathiae]MDE8340231.1 UDP-N-acetylmuramate--L-alanine ligase [Erysipelothrix rhusiopathiae]MDE8340949.1 UDP-N-acetylmuramate--L-alanine ligase [Erysipelothrix rhusiopathiae]STD01319.1 UDP-N-acetylmuramate--L-alanine ligase [Erysipelothrix rhusiopathiae]